MSKLKEKLYLAKITRPIYDNFDSASSWEVIDNLVINDSQYAALDDDEADVRITKELSIEEAKNYTYLDEHHSRQKRNGCEWMLHWDDIDGAYNIKRNNKLYDSVKISDIFTEDEYKNIPLDKSLKYRHILNKFLENTFDVDVREELLFINSLEEDGSYCVDLRYSHSNGDVFDEVDTISSQKLLSLIGTENTPYIFMEHLEQFESKIILDSLNRVIESSLHAIAGLSNENSESYIDQHFKNTTKRINCE